jgi:hypothetical protein
MSNAPKSCSPCGSLSSVKASKFATSAQIQICVSGGSGAMLRLQNMTGHFTRPEIRHVKIHAETVVHFRNPFRSIIVTHWSLFMVGVAHMQPC